jgi:hypothetical protein
VPISVVGGIRTSAAKENRAVIRAACPSPSVSIAHLNADGSSSMSRVEAIAQAPTATSITAYTTSGDRRRLSLAPRKLPSARPPMKSATSVVTA